MSLPVTDHFSLDEFSSHDAVPYPTDTPEDDGSGTWLQTRLLPLCTVLEAIRGDLGGHPVTILSGYRSPAHNLAVGGAKASQHMAGRAADITVEGYAPSDVHAAVIRMFLAGRIKISGLGKYKNWIHIDIRPWPGHLCQWEGSKIGDEAT